MPYIKFKKLLTWVDLLCWRKCLDTSQDFSNVLRCPEKSRLTESSLVKCTRQSMCPCAFVIHYTLALVYPQGWLLCSRPRTPCRWCRHCIPCTHSHCTLGVPVPLMLRHISETRAHARLTGASVADHVRALIPKRSEEIDFRKHHQAIERVVRPLRIAMEQKRNRDVSKSSRNDATVLKLAFWNHHKAPQSYRDRNRQSRIAIMQKRNHDVSRCRNYRVDDCRDLILYEIGIGNRALQLCKKESMMSADAETGV